MSFHVLKLLKAVDELVEVANEVSNMHRLICYKISGQLHTSVTISLGCCTESLFDYHCFNQLQSEVLLFLVFT